MPLAARLSCLLELAIGILLLAGLRARRYHRLAPVFALYLATVLTCNGLVATWPDRFFTIRYWVLFQSLQLMVKWLLLLELSRVVFAGLPGARTTSQRTLLIGILLVGMARAAWHGAGSAEQSHLALWAWILNGTGAMFVAFWAAALWYRVPLHPLHRAILSGLGIYSALFTALTALVSRMGENVLELMGHFNVGAYCLLLAWWSYVVWCNQARPAGREPSMVGGQSDHRDRRGCPDDLSEGGSASVIDRGPLSSQLRQKAQ